MAGSGLIPLQSFRYMRLAKILFRIKKGLKRREVTVSIPVTSLFKLNN